MGEVVLGGREEHVESDVKSGNVVAAPVPLVHVVFLVKEESLRQILDHLGKFDGDELQGKNDL